MYDDVLTRNDEGELAVRTVSSTEQSTVVNPNDVYTRDTDGNLAIRVVGSGGGDSHNLGYFDTLQDLQTAYPTGEAGDWAIVAESDTVYIWDETQQAWVDSDQKGQVTSVNNQTGAVTIGINDILPTQTDKSGYVLGTDGFVAGWVKPEIVQRSALPQASEEEVDKIYQYVGTTDANYTNGYFYKCVSDGQVPATYSWEQVDVQPTPSGLPDQTGQSGKFLTTDGTDASWSDTIGQNLIIKSASLYYSGVVVVKGYNNNNNILNLSMVPNTGQFELDIRNNSGTRTGWYYFDSAFYPHATMTTSTLGKSTNVWANVFTTKINNGSDITVPNQTGTMVVADYTTATAGQALVLNSQGNAEWKDIASTPATAPTLLAANWSSNQQTVNVTGVTATNTVIVAPYPTDAEDYAAAGVLCVAQGAGTLTFSCTTTPVNDLQVNVVII